MSFYDDLTNIKNAVDGYKSCLHDVAERYKKHYQQIHVYDTSTDDQNHVSYTVTKNILEIFRDSKSEKVGYFKSDYIQKTLPLTFQFNETSLENLRLEYDVRKTVEENDFAIQPIPILVLTNKERTKVLAVKKNKRNTSSNSPESGKLLVYLGGHIRQEDEFKATDNRLLSIAKLALTREIKEEIGLDYVPPETYSNPLCIWLRDNNRSKKHIALCFILETDVDIVKIKLDSNEFTTTGNKSGKIFDVQEIVTSKDLEGWSKLILDKIFCSQMTMFSTYS